LHYISYLGVGYILRVIFLVSKGNNMLLCQKSQKVIWWLFSCDFLKSNVKKALTTNLLFEKCQTTEYIIFLGL
jgi:hypothetical protein